MATRKSGCNGNWTEGHRRVLGGGRHAFPESGDWALTSRVGNRRDDTLPTYRVPASILPSIRQAWKDLRDEILAGWTTETRMPWAWWIFDSPESRDLSVHESEQLHRLGLLADEIFNSPHLQMSVENYRSRMEARNDAAGM